MWGEARRAVSDDGEGGGARAPDDDTSQSGKRLEETRTMGRDGAMLNYLLVALVSATVAALLMSAWKDSQPKPVLRWVTVCGECAREASHGAADRTQLYVELWDTFGMMYAKVPVGVGENLQTQPVGPWLVTALKGQVEQINRMQAEAARAALRVVE